MAKKLIIIDDSPTSLNFLKTFFGGYGWETYGASSVKDALGMIYNVAPDLIITDAIMPQIGGFQFLKITREDTKISKIPIIVYSVLPASNAKFYIKENLGEYFLSKNDNQDELLTLAEAVVEKHPVSEEYKNKIKLTKLDKNSIGGKENLNTNTIKSKTETIDADTLENSFREKYNFSLSDEKIFVEIFPLLDKILDYNLCVVVVDYFEKNEKTLFCDIKDILLSPIFQNAMLEKYTASDIVLYKKYAPNLKMIVNEEEFLSKIEFNFEYRNENIAHVIFYSTQNNKWQDEKNNEILEEVLYRFFRARYINKKSAVNKKDNFAEKYFSDKFDFSLFNKSENEKEGLYTCVLEIMNYADFKDKFSPEDLDLLNSKISEKIIKYIDGDEQVYKNDEDEYILLIRAKDEKHALSRLNSILNILSGITLDNLQLEALIGASSCTIDGSYNIYEAQKRARSALDEANSKEKAVIKS